MGAFLVERWLPSAAATLRPGTLSLYETLVRVHVVPSLGARRLQGLTGADLNRLYAQLAAAGSEEEEGRSAPMPCAAFTACCIAPYATPCAGRP